MAIVSVAHSRDQWEAFANRLMDFIRNADVSSGICCCGDYMKGHASPINCGHSPVDMWDEAVFSFTEEFERMTNDHK